MTPHSLSYLVNGIVLSLIPGVPLLLALGSLLTSTRETAYRMFPWALLPALPAVLFIPGDVVVHVPWFFMGSSMGLDTTGRIFLALTSFVWLLASLSSFERFRNDPHRFAWTSYFLASMTGNLGLILAQDMLGYYLFFAIMSFSAYGLIAHDRTDEARKAGRVYLVLVIISELAMFTALVILSGDGQAPSVGGISPDAFSTAVVVLLFIAFGIKIGALPFQSWMVLSYQQAPIPAATALAGAMVNAGILGWLRFFPFGQVALPGGALFFTIMGALATVYGVAYGIFQHKIGRVLASSSISQMGLVTMIAGLGLLSFETGRYAVTLLTVFAVHHSLAKTSLFLGYDVVDRGESVSNRLLLAGLLLPCLSLSGFPLTSGAVLKTGLKELAAAGGETWYLVSKVFLPVSSAGTTVLMLHCLTLMRQQRSSVRAETAHIVPWLWTLSVAGAAAVVWLWPAARSLSAHSLRPGSIVQSLWPVVLGAILALTWFHARFRFNGTQPPVPDFDSLLQKSTDAFMAALACVTNTLNPVRQTADSRPVLPWYPLSSKSILAQRLDKSEKVLGRWSVVGLCYVIICVLLLMSWQMHG